MRRDKAKNRCRKAEFTAYAKLGGGFGILRCALADLREGLRTVPTVHYPWPGTLGKQPPGVAARMPLAQKDNSKLAVASHPSTWDKQPSWCSGHNPHPKPARMKLGQECKQRVLALISTYPALFRKHFKRQSEAAQCLVTPRNTSYAMIPRHRAAARF